jgi:hypothetical protein
VTSDTLLVNLKDRAAIPPASVILTDAGLLTAATEELQAFVAPLLASCNEEYFTTSSDLPIVSGTSAYDIPSRAASGAIRALKFVDASSVETPVPVPRIELPDIGRYSSLSSSYPVGFYFTATQIVVVPAPTASSGSLRPYYSARPGTLVNGTSVVTVTNISDTVITAALVTPAIFAIGQTIDVVSPNPPFKMRAKDLSITGSNGTTITIGAGGLTAAGVALGDYVTIANTSYVPQLPLEWHSLLELRTAVRVFAIMGDMEGRQEASASAMDMAKTLIKQAQPRSAGNPKRISAWR